METIELQTCTPRQVVDRSILLHPTLLCEKLRANAAIHSQAARTMLDSKARDIATGCANNCRMAANKIESGSDFTAETPFGIWLQVFSAAAKLQCLTHAQACEILDRGQFNSREEP